MYAVKNMVQDEILILAGKGHEMYQEIQGEKFLFNEKEIINQTLEKNHD